MLKRSKFLACLKISAHVGTSTQVKTTEASRIAIFLLAVTALGLACPVQVQGQAGRHFVWYYMNTVDPAGQNRRDWYEESDGGWREIYPNGIQGHLSLIASGVTLTIFQNGQRIVTTGHVVEKDDHTLIAFIPDLLTTGQWLQWKAPGSFAGRWGYAGEIVDVSAATEPGRINEQVPQASAATQAAQQQQPQQAQQESTSISDGRSDTKDDSDRQQEIQDLQNDIEMQERSAETYEQSADKIANNNPCYGAAAAICQSMNDIAAAKERAHAAEARNKVDADRERIEQLQGEEVQARQSRDTSFVGNLAQTMQSSQQSSKATAGGTISNSSAAGDGGNMSSYDPERHYSGIYSGDVSTLLARSGSWSCPTSANESFSWQPPIQAVCMRDGYILAAVASAYGAECEARLGRDSQAEQDAKNMEQDIVNAKKMCSNAPTIQNNGRGCSTLRIVPCP